jgi:glycosyltransferase involved in cell wall biosynthesis
MRVLLISHTCQSATEGQPRAVEIAKLPGVELCVLVPERWKHYGSWRRPEVPVEAGFAFETGRVRWPWLPGAQNYLHYYPDLGRLLRKFQPEVIDLWEEPWSLVSAHACWMRNRHVPSARIVSETEQNIFKKLPPPFETLRRYVHRQSSFLIGRSHEAVEVSRRKGCTASAEVVPNGVDTDLFRPLDRAASRRELLGAGFENKFVAGYVGRLVPEKGLADMVHALRLCDPAVHLLFVGAGPMREELPALAARLGVAERVTILPQQPLQALPRVMNALDALVLVSRTTPSWKEQFGRVIIEAHACGIPAIGSNSGAIPDVVGNGGMIVPESSPAELAGALRNLATDPALCARMGQAGRERAVADCSWVSIARRMARIYSSVIAQRKVAPSRNESALAVERIQ